MILYKMRERSPFSATKQLALLHPDRTLTVYASEIGIEQARREAADFDENQDDPDLFTKVVSLRVEDIEVLEVPSLNVATNPVTDQSPWDGSRPSGTRVPGSTVKSSSLG